MKTVFKHFRKIKGKNELAPWFKPFVNENGVTIRPDYIPDEKGGLTICVMMDGDHVLSWGIAECSPRDSFCYQIGRAISKGRAESWLNGATIKYCMGEKSLCRQIFNDMNKVIQSVNGLKGIYL